MNAPVSEQITQRSASNLALAFILLPPKKRAAMSALYAFCREVDDIADEESRPVEERRAALQSWRVAVHTACTGGDSEMTVVQELKPYIETYALRFDLFDQLLQGVEMDLEIERYATREALEDYCYHVASVVGLLSIEIFGYQDPACQKYANSLGKALQLTNILRDVGGDARRGRIYLPTDLLTRFQVRPEEVLKGTSSDRFEALAREVAGWAKEHYAQAKQWLPPSERRRMIAAELMGAVYWRLLREVEKRRFAVLNPVPIRLSKSCKIRLTLLAWLRVKSGLPVATYG